MTLRSRHKKYRAARPAVVVAERLDVEDQIETALHPAELELIDCDAGLCDCRVRDNGSFRFSFGASTRLLVGLRVVE